MPEERKPSFGKYVVKEIVGTGGVGRVWRAFDPDLQVPVVIKELGGMRHDPRTVERFCQAGRIQSGWHHPNIGQVFEVCSDPPYVVMEDLGQRSLQSLTQAGESISLGRIVRILSQVCDGLTYLHRAGIVHRDMKPANIALVEADTAKIVGLDLCKASSGSQTPTQVILGTIPYMSPEQITSPLAVDGRTDLWALGVILFEVTQRNPPFPGPGDIQTMFHIVHSPPAPFGVLPPPIADRLAALLTSALQKDPAMRIGTAGEFKTLLEDLLQVVADAESIVFA